jgi:hypothetical protein
MIRRSKFGSDYEQLQNWKLLDRHSSEPFNTLLVKMLDVSCKEELKAVKLTQEGINNSSDKDNWCSLRIKTPLIFLEF